MPSVQAEQIQAESEQLAALFEEPQRFVRALDFHLEKYANRAKRPGKRWGTSSLLKHYDVPNPVVQDLRRALYPIVIGQPQHGLALIDALWERRSREQRELAAYLLGQLPDSKFHNVRARLERWGKENRDEQLLRRIAKLGSASICSQAPLELLPLCKRLLRASDSYQRGLGLLILRSLIDEGQTDDLPAIMDLMLPLYRKPQKSLRPYLLETIESLIARSPGEALYFLQQRLSESNNAGIRWLAKQAQKSFGKYEGRLLNDSLMENKSKTTP